MASTGRNMQLFIIQPLNTPHVTQLCLTTYHFPSFTHTTGMTHFLGLRLCFTQTGLNNLHFGYSVNITTFIVRLLVKAIVPILNTAFQPTKSKTFELCDLFFCHSVWRLLQLSFRQCAFQRIFYYPNEHNTLNTVRQSVFYNMFRPFVSAKIRQTHINIIGKVQLGGDLYLAFTTLEYVNYHSLQRDVTKIHTVIVKIVQNSVTEFLTKDTQ